MTQLIINGTEYPETSNDNYRCYTEDLGEALEMASGRMVYEKRGLRTVIEYSYDYFIEDGLMRACLADLSSGNEIECTYIDPEDDEVRTELFRCTKRPAPSWAFSIGGVAHWHNTSFQLKGVRPRA